MDGPGAGQRDAFGYVIDGQGTGRVLLDKVPHGKGPGLTGGLTAQEAGQRLDIPVQKELQLTA
jgi:hypothetical protein